MPWLTNLRPLGPWFFRLVMTLLQKGLDPWVRPWHALRAELHLPKTSHSPLFEGQFSPYLTLCMFSPSFAAPQPDWQYQGGYMHARHDPTNTNGF